jgi:DMSO/TMAO reductase YedYZ molybdopterin-dependent catalytic subunit
VHVASSLAAIVVASIHVIARPIRPRRADLSRRNLLRAGALTAGAAVVYGGLEGSLRAIGAPGASRRETGSHELGSFDPDLMPVTQWLNDDVQAIDLSAWRLELKDVTGTRTLTLSDLTRFSDTIRSTLDCTGGWFAEQGWEGLLLTRLTEGLTFGGSSVMVRSATGYSRRFPVSESDRLLLATRVGGSELSAGHGAPLRLVAPGRRGFWWVKWVTSIEIDDTPWWWQPPFPLT